MKVPRLDLRICDAGDSARILGAIASVVGSGVFVGGDAVETFERALERFVGAPVVTCASGTDALTLALMGCLGTRPACTKVVTSALSFSATASAILRAGFTPHFVDIDPATYLIDWDQAASVEDAACILPVHLYGRASVAPPSLRVPVVGDACQAILTGGDPTPFAALSFFPSKPLGCYGDGGAVVCPRQVVPLVRSLAHHGATTRYVSDRVGFNSRLDAVQAAILGVKLSKVHDHARRRAAIAATYDQELRDVGGIGLPGLCPGHAWHCYVIRVPGRRDDLLAHLHARGIDAVVQYPVPLHEQPAFARKTHAPHAEQACREILGLPIWSGMTDVQVGYVIEAVRSF